MINLSLNLSKTAWLESYEPNISYDTMEEKKEHSIPTRAFIFLLAKTKPHHITVWNYTKWSASSYCSIIAIQSKQEIKLILKAMLLGLT